MVETNRVDWWTRRDDAVGRKCGQANPTSTAHLISLVSDISPSAVQSSTYVARLHRCMPQGGSVTITGELIIFPIRYREQLLLFRIRHVNCQYDKGYLPRTSLLR